MALPVARRFTVSWAARALVTSGWDGAALTT